MNRFFLIFFVILIASCASQNKISSNEIMANEPFLIYKTKANYFDKVPVLMNEEKTVIVSYPAPSDLRIEDKLAIPTQLIKGYLLDNRGIGLNIAFTSFTYKEYANLKETPSIEEFFEHMLDKDPLLELYDCSNNLKIKRDIEKINKMVKRGFKACKKLK